MNPLPVLFIQAQIRARVAPVKTHDARLTTAQRALQFRQIRFREKVGRAPAVLARDRNEIVDKHTSRIALFGAPQQQSPDLGPAFRQRLERLDDVAFHALHYIQAQLD